MFFSLLGCEKQQSSLYAPWAQVCNENRSTAITQKICAWAHTESPTCRFSAAFFGAFVFFFYFALCQMRPCYVCGAEGGVKGEWSGEGRRMLGETVFVLKGSDVLNFRFTIKTRWHLFLLSSFVIFLKPRHTTKVKRIWLILHLVKIPHCVPVYSMPFSKANRVRHPGNSSIHGFSGLQVNGALGTWIKELKRWRWRKLCSTTPPWKIPLDRSPGEESKIEKTPLRHPLLLQDEINEVGRAGGRKGGGGGGGGGEGQRWRLVEDERRNSRHTPHRKLCYQIRK